MRRANLLTFRIGDTEDRELRRLARALGLGVSTLARLAALALIRDPEGVLRLARGADGGER